MIRDTSNKPDFLWVGQRGLDIVGISCFADVSIAVCCDYGKDIKQLEQQTHVLSLEKSTGMRDAWSSRHIDMAIEMFWHEIVDTVNSKQGETYIIAYSATRGLHSLQERLSPKLKISMPDYKAKMLLDDKLYFISSLQRMGIPRIPGYETTLGELGQRLSKKAEHTVVTLPASSSGSGIFHVKGSEDVKILLRELGDIRVLASTYINGISLNINGAVLDETVILTPLSIQLVGLHECTTRPSTYCGNDFVSAKGLSLPVKEKTYDYALRIGHWIQQQGFRGMFGIDFMMEVETDHVYPVDLNPRFQNSTFLLNQYSAQHSIMPLSLLVSMLSLGLVGVEEVQRFDFSHFEGISFAQIILHSLLGHSSRVTGCLQPGVYSILEGGAFSKNGLSLLDLTNCDETVVTCGVPLEDTVVTPNAALFKILCNGPVLNQDLRTLQQPYSRLCETLKDTLALQVAN